MSSSPFACFPRLKIRLCFSNMFSRECGSLDITQVTMAVGLCLRFQRQVTLVAKWELENAARNDVEERVGRDWDMHYEEHLKSW